MLEDLVSSLSNWPEIDEEMFIWSRFDEVELLLVLMVCFVFKVALAVGGGGGGGSLGRNGDEPNVLNELDCLSRIPLPPVEEDEPLVRVPLVLPFVDKFN